MWWLRFLPSYILALVAGGLIYYFVYSHGFDGTQAVAAGSVGSMIALAVFVLMDAAPGRALRTVEEEAKKTLEQRLEELSKSMRASAQIVEQVSAELEARAATARRLSEEAETAEAISRLHKEESEAVRRMLDAQLETVTLKIRSDSIKIGIASFLGGAGVTLLITLLVHPLS